jgi:hydroxymethylbilane synthase
MKDMQTLLPDGLILGATLPREDVRDAFLSLRYASIDEVPAGSTVGSSSLRRQAQLLNMRPDLNVTGFRGNVQTRLKKLEDGVAAATFLAVAGLKRLKLEDRITAMIPTEQMLPAVAQGAIGIEIKAEDERTAQFIAPLNHEPTALAVTAERAFLRKLEGSCRTPIAGLAELKGSQLVFRGQVLSPDGKVSYRAERTDAPERAAQIGITAAEEILSKADPAVLATVHS